MISFANAPASVWQLSAAHSLKKDRKTAFQQPLEPKFSGKGQWIGRCATIPMLLTTLMVPVAGTNAVTPQDTFGSPACTSYLPSTNIVRNPKITMHSLQAAFPKLDGQTAQKLTEVDPLLAAVISRAMASNSGELNELQDTDQVIQIASVQTKDPRPVYSTVKTKNGKHLIAVYVNKNLTRNAVGPLLANMVASEILGAKATLLWQPLDGSQIAKTVLTQISFADAIGNGLKPYLGTDPVANRIAEHMLQRYQDEQKPKLAETWIPRETWSQMGSRETIQALDSILIGTSGAFKGPANIKTKNQLPSGAGQIAKALVQHRCNDAAGPNALLKLMAQSRASDDPVAEELGDMLKPVVQPDGSVSFKVQSFDFGDQGPIGDCYVIAPFQAALQNSHIGAEGISDMLLPFYDPASRYKIGFHVIFPGYPDYIITVRPEEIDPEKHVSSVNNRLAWQLLELAYAKLAEEVGLSYRYSDEPAISTIDNGGYPGDVLYALTGQKPETVAMPEAGPLLKEIKANPDRYLLVPDTSENPPDSRFVGNHAYSMVPPTPKELRRNPNADFTVQNPWNAANEAFPVTIDELRNAFQGLTYVKLPLPASDRVEK